MFFAHETCILILIFAFLRVSLRAKISPERRNDIRELKDL